MKALEVDNLVKAYPDFKLGPLSLELDPGVVLGYIGPDASRNTSGLTGGLLRAKAEHRRAKHKLVAHRNPTNAGGGTPTLQRRVAAVDGL